MVMTLQKVTSLLLICSLLCGLGHPMSMEEMTKSIPKGVSLLTYAGICEACGEFYGNRFTYRCLTDKSFETYRKCNIAVTQKRK